MLAASVAGVAASAVMAVLCVRFGLDQIVVGIAIVLTAEGVTSLLQGAQYGTTYPRLPSAGSTPIPLLDGIPVVGPGLFDQHLAVYLTGALVAATAWMLRSTRLGLNIRAAGERPAAVDAAGVSVTATRIWSELACGALAGLGGGFLAIVGAGIFVPFMTTGLGFIAIVVAMLGRGKPVWVAFGASLFGTALALQTALQIAGIEISNDVVQMLPFVTVIVALLLFARRSYLPATLGLPYVRGAR
jgi:simple sugar transport system permease protein